MAIANINNGEGGASIRTKLNSIISYVNQLIAGVYATSASVAAKVPITVPAEVADSASVVYDCGSTDNKQFYHTSANANTAVAIAGLKNGGRCQVLPLTISTLATYTYTFTATDPDTLADLTVKVLGAGGNVLQIVNQAANTDYELLIQRSGDTIYIIQLNEY